MYVWSLLPFHGVDSPGFSIKRIIFSNLKKEMVSVYLRVVDGPFPFLLPTPTLRIGRHIWRGAVVGESCIFLRVLVGLAVEELGNPEEVVPEYSPLPLVLCCLLSLQAVFPQCP